MDGRSYRRNKAAFSNFSGVVGTLPEWAYVYLTIIHLSVGESGGYLPPPFGG